MAFELSWYNVDKIYESITLQAILLYVYHMRNMSVKEVLQLVLQLRIVAALH